jgi:hypothetical protein
MIIHSTIEKKNFHWNLRLKPTDILHSKHTLCLKFKEELLLTVVFRIELESEMTKTESFNLNFGLTMTEHHRQFLITNQFRKIFKNKK